MLSWAFIRAVPDEIDTRFWQVVWETTGAGMTLYHEFQRAGTTEVAAHRLADALNQFAPKVERPAHRAPDIIALVGTEQLSATLRKAKNPLLRCHAFDPIVRYLDKEQLLEPTPYALMRGLVGQTRLVVISDGNEPEQAIARRVTPLEAALLRSLSVFRFGFTQQMARFVWDMSGFAVAAREQLESFITRGLLHYGFGEYYLPGKIGLAQPGAKTAQDRAQHHYIAGLALAPYVAGHEVPGLSFDEAFQAEHVHEAHFHLHSAHDLLEKSDTDAFRARTQTALLRLQRFAEYPGWGAVINFLKSGNAAKDAYELAVEFMTDREDAGTPIHPIQFLTVAQAAEQRWMELRSDAAFKGTDELSMLRDQIDELYARAALACERVEYATERAYNRLSVLTRHITFLEKHGEPTGRQGDCISLHQLRADAWQLLDADADGTAARGAWYESEGDRHSEHQLAAKAYRYGVRWAPEWHQLWIKMLGCTSLQSNGLTDNDVLTELGKRIEDVLKYSVPGIRRDRKQGKPSIKERWTAGLQVCEQHFNSPRLQSQYQLYRSELAGWGTRPEKRRHSGWTREQPKSAPGPE